MGDIYIVS